MSTRNRLNPKEAAGLADGLYGVLRNTIDYLDIPLTDEQMVDVWEIGLPTEIKNAYLTLHASGYSMNIHCRRVLFYVPDLKMDVSFYNRDRQERFLNTTTKGPWKMFKNTRGTSIRHVPLIDFENALAKDTYTEFLVWCSAVAKCDERQSEAHAVIDDIIKMLSTAGQLRRMVPELVQYLPDNHQKAIADQLRASPFPAEWAAYPKDKVDRLLAALAEGHLFHGMGKRDTANLCGWESWAKYCIREKA
jgi:hypothetical protein